MDSLSKLFSSDNDSDPGKKKGFKLSKLLKFPKSESQSFKLESIQQFRSITTMLNIFQDEQSGLGIQVDKRLLITNHSGICGNA
jgi:hypothetical protein